MISWFWLNIVEGFLSLTDNELDILNGLLDVILIGIKYAGLQSDFSFDEGLGFR